MGLLGLGWVGHYQWSLPEQVDQLWPASISEGRGGVGRGAEGWGG